MKTKKNTELMVGIFVLTGLALMAFLMIQFGRLGDGGQDRYLIKVEFSDATGVIKGSEVRMGGAIVGAVAAKPQLKEDSSGVILELSIQEEVRIPEGASIQVASLNFLGDRYIEIRPPLARTGRFLGEGALVKGTKEGGIEQIKETAMGLSDQATITMKRVDKTLVTADEVLENLNIAAKQMAEVSTKINQGVLADENLKSIKSTIAQVEQLTTNLKGSSEQIEPLMNEATLVMKETRGAVHDAKESMALFKQIMIKADARMDDLQPTFKALPATVDQIRTSLAKASVVMDQLSDKKGLLGALTHDDRMKADAKIFLQNLRQYGILRYRDPEAEPAIPEKPNTRRR